MQASAPSYSQPTTTRRASFFHAFILLSSVVCGTLAATVIGPILPVMQQHFQAVPGIQTLVPVVVTLPMLVLAALAAVIGWTADRIGRKRVLVASLVLYAVAGTAPLYLNSIYVILASRALVGVAEAAAMTCSTTLIGDYFSGERRDKYISLQTTFASISAFIFNLVGGTLGSYGWRTPFVVYTLTLLIAPLVQIFIWEPGRNQSVEDRSVKVSNEPEFNPWLLALVCVVAFFAGAAFLMVPIHLSFMLVELGITSTQQIGLAYAINSLGVIIGTVAFGWIVVKRLGVFSQLLLATLVCGVGFVLMGTSHSFGALSIGGIVNGLGCGLLLPASVSWALRTLPFERRGFGIGAYMASQCIGYFCNPFLVMPIVARMGSRFPAVETWGIALVATTFFALAVSVLKRRPSLT
ncbi:MFS transporter [Burkholderia seminalis]|uniref:MFS transporter n=1 Tax=Burkholderia seminalis TaxID=488731 RepID=UPI00158C681D|nr:MFS transporter [Burkholderia seminalis]